MSRRSFALFAGTVFFLAAAKGQNTAVAAPSGQNQSSTQAPSPVRSEKTRKKARATPARAARVPQSATVTTSKTQGSSALPKGQVAPAVPARTFAPATLTQAKPTPTPVPAPTPSNAELFSLVAQDVYFDVDKADLRPDAKQKVEQLAQMIAAHPTWKVQIEGNCDATETGSVEESLALGERRSESARMELLLSGVSPDALKIISYGNVKPICTDLTDNCLLKNRRVHFTLLP